MNHESFSDPVLADLINTNFIPIKVDRDQRPDVDSVYTMYMQATTGSGGWPLNLFLEPNSLSPFYGGMYWPSQISSDGKTSFHDVLTSVLNVWKHDEQKCVESAHTVRDRLVKLHDAQSGAEYDELRMGIFDEVRDHFNRHYDANYGGFTEAPKFPCPHNLSFLLKHGHHMDGQGDTSTFTDKSLFTLRKIGESALKDQLGHGFSRYSQTIDWSLPHFEKLLIDQALLLSSYTHAYQVTANSPDRDVYAHYMKDIVTYLTTTLASPDGGFYTAQDGDSLPSRSILSPELADGQYPQTDGAYYLWQYNDFEKPLTRFEMDVASSHWNVQELGNIDGEMDVYKTLAFQNTLYTAMPAKEIAGFFGKREQAIKDTIESARQKLRKHREETRDAPSVDEKILAGWNGAAIGALAQASTALRESDPETSKRALQAAEAAARFVLDKLFADQKTGTLRRMFSYGQPSTTEGMLDDYVYLVSGLLDLYQATFNTHYLDVARRLQEVQLVLFWDQKNGGFYTVPPQSATSDKSELLLTPKQGFDGSEPSPNGVACENLFRLSAHLADPFFESYGEGILECYGKELTAQPFGYASMLGSVVASLKGFTSVVIVGGEPGSDRERDLVRELTAQRLIPNLSITRVTADSVAEYYERYGNSFYGALQDKYGEGPVKFLVTRTHQKLSEEPVETVEQVIEILGRQTPTIVHP